MKTKLLFFFIILISIVQKSFAQCSTPITGASSICEIGEVQLYDGTPGGTWSSSPGTGTGTIDASGLFNGTSAGTVNITYSVGACTYNYTMTVNPNPVLSGSSTVAVGATIAYSTSVGGGTWFISDPSIATIDATGNVTGIAVGSVTIAYTAATGCKNAYNITVVNCSYPISGSSAACVGTSITLADADPSPGSWTSSAPAVASVGSGSGMVTGVATGSAIITYATASGCVYTYPVTVGNVPSSVAASAAPSLLCTGSALTLIGSATGATSFSWSGPGGYSAAVANPASFTVSTVSAGVYTLTAANGCGSVSATTSPIVVQVMPNAGVLSGTSPICEQATSAFTTSGDAGGTWSSSATLIATVDASTGVVTGAVRSSNSMQTATITYTVSNTCGSTFSTRNISVKGIPIISGTHTACYNVPATTLTYTGTPFGGTASWTVVYPALCNTSISTTSSNVGYFTGLATSSADVAYFCYNYPGNSGTCADSISKGVIIAGANISFVSNSDGSGSSSPVTSGRSVTLSGSPNGGTWSIVGPSDLSTVTSSSPSRIRMSRSLSGSATITVTYAVNYGGCIAYGYYTQAAAKPSGSAEVNNNELSPQYIVYPNPSQGKINIRQLEMNDTKAVIQVYNMAGMLVYDQPCRFLAGEAEIYLQGAANGLYNVMITDDTGQQAVARIVIEQ